MSAKSKNIWNIVVQVLLSALTALSGLLAGCQWMN